MVDVKIMKFYREIPLYFVIHAEYVLTVFFGEYDFIWELVSKANELDCDVVVAFLFGDDVMVNSNSGMVF